MKKFLIPAMALTILAACSKDNRGENGADPNDLAITMASGLGADIRRSAVESDDNGKPTSGDAEIGFLRAPDGATPVWNTGTFALTEGDGKAGGGYVKAKITQNTNTVVYTPTVTGTVQFYNSNAGLKSHLIGFAPFTGANIAHVNGTAPTVSWTVDGKTDIMTSTYVTADKTIKQEALTANRLLKPRFQHRLAWIRFYVKADDADAATVWGTVTKIQIVGKSTDKADTETVTGLENTYTATFNVTTAGEYPTGAFSGATSVASPISTFQSDWSTVGNVELNTSEAVLQALIPASATYAIHVHTKAGTAAEVVHKYNIPADFTDGGAWKSGSGSSLTAPTAGAYTDVHMNFKANTIEMEAFIEPWKDGTDNDWDID